MGRSGEEEGVWGREEWVLGEGRRVACLICGELCGGRGTMGSADREGGKISKAMIGVCWGWEDYVCGEG